MADRTPLEPGEHSIDRVKAERLPSGSRRISWRLCLPDGSVIERQTQGKTAGIARQRAKQKAQQLLESAESDGRWTRAHTVREYVESVTVKVIEQAKLEPNTKARYRTALRQILGDCDGHEHEHALSDIPIGQLNRIRPYEQCIVEISALHGRESARHARSVIERYLVDQLRRDGLLSSNPIDGVHIDLGAPTERTRGGVALSLDQWTRVVDYLLNLDPSAGVVRRQGRWSIEHLINVQRNAIDLTLLQVATGLRVSEANAYTWDRVVEQGGHMLVQLDSATKTDRGRYLAVVDPRVSERLLARRSHGGRYVIGSPTDPDIPWDARNCAKKTSLLYQQVARDLGIVELENERTHVWRTTLNKLFEPHASAYDRAAWFGHSVEVNERSYNSPSDATAMLATARKALGLGA